MAFQNKSHKELVNKYTVDVVSTIIGDVDNLYKHLEHSSNRWYVYDFEHSLEISKTFLITNMLADKLKI